MKNASDKFSLQSNAYKKFRPTYPKTVYDKILSYTKGRGTCWDCGTGNGQVAYELSNHFKKVNATDISQAQINNAKKRDNIIYSVQRAEQSSFDDQSFDLITVAQAAHWFDLAEFSKEVKRVLKEDGIIAIWGYGLLRINPIVDSVIDNFYRNVVGKYWDPERKHVENAYMSLSFDFKEISFRNDLSIDAKWSLVHLEGYFNSWSSVQNFINANNGENPVRELMSEIAKVWKKENEEVHFPIFIRIGVV